MDTIQVELTSACVLRCSNCTRFCGTHKVPFFLEEADFEAAIDSLAEFALRKNGILGFMGGEPLLHPLFENFCAYALARVPRSNLGLWSTFPPKFRKYREVICKTFGVVLLNDHSRDDIVHAPVLMAAEDYFRTQCPQCQGSGRQGGGNTLEGADPADAPACSACQGSGQVVNEPDLYSATEHCWVQESWSACINPKGAWFCEVAGALSDLYPWSPPPDC
jgi:MoaA/NifB/PqqE/SkfB family radical SAM enzyme